MAVDTVDLGLHHLTVTDTIGRGGFSVVYRAIDTKLNRQVAVKVLTGIVGADDLDRFDQECRIHGPLSNHPNIVTIHDAGFTPGGDPFLVMEYFEHGSLTDHLAANGPMGWQQVIDWMAPICDAVDSAHRMGVLHRDIKPANLLLSTSGPKLADFGIACVSDATSPQFAVSWLHAPPESELNRRDERSDVYSLASTMFELLNGRAPFWRDGEDSLAGLLRRIVTEPAPHLPPTVAPAWLDAVLQRALAKDPNQRPATAAELRTALLAGAAGQTSPNLLQAHRAAPHRAAPLAAAPAIQPIRTRTVTSQPDPRGTQVVHPSAAMVGTAADGRVATDPTFGLASGSYGPASLGHHSVAYSPTPTPAPAKRSAKLPVFLALLALVTAGFFLSPAWAALQPDDGPRNGNAASGTDPGETVEPTTSTTADEGGATEPTAASTTSSSSSTTEASTSTTETSTSTTETTSTTDTTQPSTTETAPPPSTGEVPNVTGLARQAALDALAAEGFSDVSVATAPSESVAEGDVIRTDPANASVVELDSAITVIVSSGPDTVEVPAVVGLDRDQAVALLESLGLTVTVETTLVAIGSPSIGTVITADPGAGTSVPAGANVTITVAKADTPIVTIDPVIVGPGQVTTTTNFELVGP